MQQADRAVVSALLTKRTAAWYVAPAIVVALVAVLWWLPELTDVRSTSQASRFLLLGLAAVGLDLLWGKAGLLSFGHAALFGLGCYASGLVLTRLDWEMSTVIALFVGMVLPAGFGVVAGIVLFRGGVKGVYFGIVTLLFALLFEQLAGTWGGLTGGFNGLVVPQGFTLGPLELRTTSGMYRAVLVVVALVFLAVRWFASTPFGDAVQASRMNEARAESLGYNVVVLRTVTLAVAGGVAGLAGAMYAPVEGFIYPNQLGLVASTSFIVWVVLGGRGTLFGALLGAVLVNFLQTRLSDQFEELWPLLVGGLVVIVVLYAPGGITGVAARLWATRASRLERVDVGS